MNHRSRCSHASALLPLLLLAAAPLRALPQGAQAPFVPDTRADGLIASADGALVASAATFTARFDADGARLGVAHPSGAGAEAAVTFRLRDYGRAGHVRLADQVAPRQMDTATVHYVHRDIVARYQLGDHGFEQSFVLDRRPAGRGDYVIGLLAQGADLQLPERHAAHQALELRHAGAPTIRYGEAVAFARGGEPVEVQTRCDGSGRIELVVPAALLDTACYPVVVDPAVGPVLLPSGASLQDSLPDVALHSAAGTYLFVWQRQLSFNTEIRGRLYDRDGVALTPVTALTASAQCRNPSVCSVNIFGLGFVVAYEWADRIRVRSFDANTLAPQCPETDVTSPPSGAHDGHPSISGDGTAAALLVFDRTLAGATQPTQIVASNVYYTAALLSSAGTVLESVASGHVRHPRLARTLVYQTVSGQIWRTTRAVWERFYTAPAPGDYDLRTAVVTGRFSSLNLVGSVATVPSAGEVGPNEYRPDIAMMADSLGDPDPLFLIAWDEDGDVKAQRYTLAGALGGEIDIRSTSDVETVPAVGAGACEFTVGYLQATPPNEFSLNVRAARVLADGTVAITNRPVDVLNGPFQGGLRASSLPASTTSARRVNTTMLTWYGATGPSTGLNDVRARLFEPVAPSWLLFGSACPGPLGELPSIGVVGNPIPGNAQFEVTVGNAPANSLAVLVIGDVLATLPIPGAPGCELYLGLPALSVLAGVTDAVGFASRPVPIPCPVPSGITLAFQWGVMTPGHNAFGWITSNDVDISWTHN